MLFVQRVVQAMTPRVAAFVALHLLAVLLVFATALWVGSPHHSPSLPPHLSAAAVRAQWAIPADPSSHTPPSPVVLAQLPAVELMPRSVDLVAPWSR